MARFLPDKPYIGFVNTPEGLTCNYDDHQKLMVEVHCTAVSIPLLFRS